MADARFEDGAEAALSLKAEGVEDLAILSALVQDAILAGSDMAWDRKGRSFALFLNRFRWEDRVEAERQGRAFERTRALLVVAGVTGVSSQGIDRREADVVLSVLSLAWEPAAEGAGRLIVTLAGDGAIAIDAECLDLTLRDMTRPYLAPSRRMPSHPA